MKVNKEILHIESGVKQRVKQYIILNTSRKHVNYEEDKNKVPMNKPYKRFADSLFKSRDLPICLMDNLSWKSYIRGNSAYL